MINKVTEQNKLLDAIYAADSGDTVQVDFTPSVGFSLDIDGRKCRGVTLDLADHTFDGGKSHLIKAAVEEDFSIDVLNLDAIFTVKNPYGFKIKNGALRNCGRGLHVTGDPDDLAQSLQSDGITVDYCLERAIGGPCNNQWHNNATVQNAVYSNYNSRMKKKDNEDGGWSCAVGPYKQYGTGKSVHNFKLTNSFIGNTFGEGAATFHCKGNHFENVIFYNASHTAFVYLEQGTDIVLKNLLLVADGNTPQRWDRKPYGVMTASEGKPRWPITATIDNAIVYGSGFKSATRFWMKVDVGIDIKVSNSTFSASTVIDSDRFSQAHVSFDNCILDGDIQADDATHFGFGNNYRGNYSAQLPYGLSFVDYKPVGDVPAGSLSFVNIGDSGVNSTEQRQVADLIASEDLLIHNGDLIYTNSRDVVTPYYGKFQAAARLLSAFGNHDEDHVSIFDDELPYQNKKRWFSKRFENVLFIFLDSNDKTNATQKQWFTDTINAATAAWNVVIYHHPAYSTGRYGGASSMKWASGGADLVLTGHEHDFEALFVNGVPHIVNGCGGAGLREFGSDPMPETVFRYNKKHGALFVNVLDGTLTMSFVNVDGETIYSEVITKGGASGYGYKFDATTPPVEPPPIDPPTGDLEARVKALEAADEVMAAELMTMSALILGVQLELNKLKRGLAALGE